MFGLTRLGVIHTLISLVAAAAGLIALLRDKLISPRNRTGMVYIVATVLTCLTGFGIFQHGGFGKPHILGIITLVDGAQSAGHCPVDVQAIGCDFFAFSGHKICGPTGIGVLWGCQEILDAMPPYQGGGEMILSVGYDKTEFKHAPHRFEAGTPDISGPIGLHAAMDYLDAIGRENTWRHDQDLANYAYEKLSALKDIRLFGPKLNSANRAGLVSFLLKDVHAHDVVTLADQAGVALRGGHHCTQPLMHKLGVESTARASFYFYNTKAEVDRFVEVVKEIQKFFGQ